MMRIGIYNRYWNTKGGGEKHIGKIAEILSWQHKVELIAVEPIDAESIGKHLNIDLKRVSVKYWPPLSCADLSLFSADYDIFINSTYQSTLVSHAKKSVYLVFFPQKLVRPAVIKILRFITKTLRSALSNNFITLCGCYATEAGGLQWTGPTAKLRIKKKAFNKNDEARIKLLPMSVNRLKYLDVPLGTTWHLKDNSIVIRLNKNKMKYVDITVYAKCVTPNEEGTGQDGRKLGVCFDINKNKYQEYIDRIIMGIESNIFRIDGTFLNSYQLLIANSLYTKKWIKKRWKRDAVVLPPPINTKSFCISNDIEKKKKILSVGRFFSGGHNKKHLELIRIFKKMFDKAEIPMDWEYHIIGNLHRESKKHIQYYKDVVREAEGYPIKIFTDLPFSQLLKEYQTSSIFWHAAGLGENEKIRPERFEHFGITTCEAASSGCVPVVIEKAGQLEIVKDGINGFTFSNEVELRQKTSKLIKKYEMDGLHDLSKRARKSIEQYGHDALEEKLMDILKSNCILEN